MENDFSWPFLNTIREKQRILKEIAEWAKLIKFDKVRDFCRYADLELQDQIERAEKIKRQVEENDDPEER